MKNKAIVQAIAHNSHCVAQWLTGDNDNYFAVWEDHTTIERGCGWFNSSCVGWALSPFDFNADNELQKAGGSRMPNRNWRFFDGDHLYVLRNDKDAAEYALAKGKLRNRTAEFEFLLTLSSQ